MDHKRIIILFIKVLLEEDMLPHRGLAVVRAPSLILAQLVESYAAAYFVWFLCPFRI